MTLLFTGMRRGECSGLTWDCIDFAKQEILINKQLQRIDGKLTLVSLKNDKTRRISPPLTVFQVLAEHKSTQAQAQLLAGQQWEKNNLVFCTDIGAPCDMHAPYTAYKRLLKENNLPDLRLHDLRHSAASMMLQNGDSPIVVQKALGHFSAAFTLDTYGHVTDEMRRDSADKMEAYIQQLKAAKSS